MELNLLMSVVFSNVVEPGLNTKVVDSRVDCVIQCFYSEYCNSVFYDASSSTCHFSSNNYESSTSSMIAAPDTVYIIVKHEDIYVVGPQSECPGDFTYNATMSLCYKILDSEGSADFHTANCSALGGNLLTVDTAVRDQFLEELTGLHAIAFFFGARNDGVTWVWESGKEFGGYVNWASLNPVAGDLCARKNRGSPTWKSFDCDRGNLLSVCEHVTGFSQAQLSTCIT